MAGLIRYSAVTLGVLGLAALLLVGSWFDTELTAADRVSLLPATRLTASKSQRILTLHLKDGSSVTFAADFGSGGAGPKEREGDRKTPEGQYILHPSRESASGFVRFFPIDYPNAEDRQLGRTGGDIGLHGTALLGYLGHALGLNWTAGCIAVADDDLAFIDSAVQEPVPILIEP